MEYKKARRTPAKSSKQREPPPPSSRSSSCHLCPHPQSLGASAFFSLISLLLWPFSLGSGLGGWGAQPKANLQRPASPPAEELGLTTATAELQNHARGERPICKEPAALAQAGSMQPPIKALPHGESRFAHPRTKSSNLQAWAIELFLNTPTPTPPPTPSQKII